MHRNDEIRLLANSFRQMQHRLRTDVLTGLGNRDEMQRSISRIVQSRRTNDSMSFAVLFVDLNNFKLINDRLKFARRGRRVLVEVAQRLLKVTRACDRVARYAGDEFLLMINDIPSRQVAEQVRQNVEAVLSEPLRTVDVAKIPESILANGTGRPSVLPD